MKAFEVRPGMERWAYGHPLFQVKSVRNDGLHVYAECCWYAFDCLDDAVWHVNQTIPDMFTQGG